MISLMMSMCAAGMPRGQQYAPVGGRHADLRLVHARKGVLRAAQASGAAGRGRGHAAGRLKDLRGRLAVTAGHGQPVQVRPDLLSGWHQVGGHLDLPSRPVQQLGSCHEVLCLPTRA